MVAACADDPVEPTAARVTSAHMSGSGTGTNQFTDAASYAAAVPAGTTTTTIDFATKDDGSPLYVDAGPYFWSSLPLRGVTFSAPTGLLFAYYNFWLSNYANSAIRAALPANTYAVGMELYTAYGVPGSYTCSVSTGETVTLPLGTPFIGYTSDVPISWISCQFDNDYFLIDNFTYSVMPTLPPSATFTVPAAAVTVGTSFTLGLADASVPGRPELTAFTYAFDCGDGTGYGAITTTPSATCLTSVAETRSVKGKVISQSGQSTEYTGTVVVVQQTPTGSNVVVSPIDPATGSSPVTLSFSSVISGGTTSITSSSQGAPPPLAFKLGNPPVYYELETTATFSGSVTVCFAYDPAAFHKPGNLRLFHGNAGGGWTDVTTSNNLSGTICGSVTSFSPFVFAELLYDFTGFLAPVDNPGSGTTPVVNSIKPGSAVPVKFTLGGDMGLGVLATGAPTSAAYACATGIDAPVEQTVSANASGLTYDAVLAQYSYVWKTDKAWAGTCRRFTLTLKDGTVHEALFKFVR